MGVVKNKNVRRISEGMGKKFSERIPRKFLGLSNELGGERGISDGYY